MFDSDDYSDDDSQGDWARVFDQDPPSTDNQQVAATPDGSATDPTQQTSGGAMVHVVTNNNGAIAGTHAGFMLEQPGEEPFIYDPSGSFNPKGTNPDGTPKGRNPDGTVFGSDANLDGFRGNGRNGLSSFTPPAFTPRRRD